VILYLFSHFKNKLLFDLVVLFFTDITVLESLLDHLEPFLVLKILHIISLHVLDKLHKRKDSKSLKLVFITKLNGKFIMKLQLANYDPSRSRQLEGASICDL